MDSETILFDKEKFKFCRAKTNHYTLTFNIENENIVLSQIIDFNLIKLIYSLNNDVYEKVNIEKINDNEVIITLLIKHFFEDLGLPQRFCFVNMKKNIEDNKIVFYSQTIKSQRPPDMPEKSELFLIENMITICDIITPHKVNFTLNIIFDETIQIPPFAEKMVGMLSHKIFKRVKQFIENVSI